MCLLMGKLCFCICARMIGFILGTASRTKFSATRARNAALYMAQSRQIIAFHAPALLTDLSGARSRERWN
jgi:hypothetical protein